MTVLLPTPDAALVSRFASGDENALVALYRHEYDGLVALAAEGLGHELTHFRGRVAQQAMLDAWAARGRLQNAEGLASFLEEAIRQEVAIQRRKHAALHHREGIARAHVTVPSVDDAVVQLLAVLHATPVDHAEAAHAALAAKRSHATEHVARVAGRPRWGMYGAIGVATILAIAAAQQYLDRTGADVTVDRALAGDDVQTLTSGKGQRGTVTLRDGTRVALGSDSRVRVPAGFGSALRTVELEGTATFTVPATSGTAAPRFAVRASEATITGAGAVFTVRHFSEDSAVIVAVSNGQVMLRDRASDTEQSVTAGQAVQLSQREATALTPVVRDAALAWTRDSLVFVDAPLRTVVPELARWFGLNAVLADSSIGTRRVSLRLALSSSGDATRALTEAAQLIIRFGRDDRLEFLPAPNTGRR